MLTGQARTQSAEGNEMLIKSLHPGRLLVSLIWVMCLYVQSRKSESGDTRWGNCQNHFQKNSSRFGIWVGWCGGGKEVCCVQKNSPAPQSAAHGELKQKTHRNRKNPSASQSSHSFLLERKWRGREEKREMSEKIPKAKVSEFFSNFFFKQYFKIPYLHVLSLDYPSLGIGMVLPGTMLMTFIN